MIEELYTLIKSQQYPPPFFSTTLHNTVLQAIQDSSQILAVGLVQIWRCKAETINPGNKTSTKRKLHGVKTSNKNPTNTTSPNTITNYFKPDTDIPPSNAVTTMVAEVSVRSKPKPNPNPTIINITSSTQPSLNSLLAPLTDEQTAQLQYALQPPYDNTMITSKFNIPITKKVIQCLNPHQPTTTQWLNEEVINYYLEMLKEKFQFFPNKLHIFDTYFMEKLSPTKFSTEVSQFKYS
jgi:Ulp1 family protease